MDPCITCGHPEEAHIVAVGCVVGSCDCDLEPGDDIESLLDQDIDGSEDYE